MLKKILTSCIFLTMHVSCAVYAGNFYMGPSLLLQNVSASDSSFRGLHPRLSLGYETISEESYLASEIFATPATIVLSDKHKNATSAKVSRSVGVALMPGLMMGEQSEGYLRLGVVNARFTGLNKSRAGGQVGCGFQTQMGERWKLRTEYLYTVYKSTAGLGSPKSNEIGIGAIFRLNT